MPRAGNVFDWSGIGTWSGPASTDTLSISGWNALRDDLKATFSNSLARDGTGSMGGPLKLDPGSVGIPGLSFSADAASGFYRANANEWHLALSGALAYQFKAGAALLDNSKTVITTDAITRTALSTVLYPITALETAAGVVTIVDFTYPPGYANRYQTNTTPGTTNMTVGVRLAIAVSASYTATFLPEIYLTSYLSPPSNSNIYLPPGCIIQDDGTLAASGAGSRVLDYAQVSNCTLVGYGAKIKGAIAAYTPASGQRHGVNIMTCTNITIMGLESTLHNEGDGFIVTRRAGFTETCTNIRLRDCKGTANFRQGLSVISVKGFRDIDGTWTGSTGATIGDGIDIEPVNNTDFLQDIKIIRPRCTGNQGAGIQIQLSAYSVSTNNIDIEIVEPYTSNNGLDAALFQPGIKIAGKSTVAGKQNNGRIRIVDATVIGEQRAGIVVSEWDQLNAIIEIVRPTVINANEANLNLAGKYSSIVLNTEGFGTTTPGAVWLDRPYIRDDSGNINGNSNLYLLYVNGRWRDVRVNDINYYWIGTQSAWFMNTVSLVFFTLSRPDILAFTADTNLDSTHTGHTLTNTGAVGTITLTLPPTLAANIGRRISFEVTVAQQLRIDPNLAGEFIRNGTAGQYMVSSTIGDSCTLEIDSGPATGQWKIVSRFGTWTFV